MSIVPFILVLIAVGALLSMVVLRRAFAPWVARLRAGSVRGAPTERAPSWGRTPPERASIWGRSVRRRPDVPRVPPDEVEVLPPGRVRSPFGRRLVIIDVDGRRHST